MIARYRLLMLGPVFDGMRPFFVDGRQTTAGMPAFANTLRYYLARGHEIHFVAISREHLRPPPVKGLFVHECRWGAGKVGTAGACLRGLAISLRLARRHRFDLVYGHGYFGGLAGVLSLIARIPNVRRIYGTVFLYWELKPPTRFPRLTAAIRNPLTWLDFVLPTHGLIITDDGTKGAEVARLLGCRADRVHFWRNGVDVRATKSIDGAALAEMLARFHIPDGRPLLIAVCRLEKYKGVDRAIRCLKHLKHEPRPVLVVVGDGPEMSSLKQLAADEGVSRDVRFLGVLSHEETLCLIRLSDISVCFYDYSNLGNVLIESMALGKCVVSMADGSLDGVIINGENGVLLDSYDPNTIACAIDRLLCDERLTMTLGEKAQETAALLFESWDARMDKEMALVEAIAAVGGGSRN